MQKLDQLKSSIDIIPLQGSSALRKSKSMNSKSCEMDHRAFRDQSLISRVQSYMSENENKIFIDVNDMADSLQRQYREYRRRKHSAFRAMVHKAYDELILKLDILNKPSHGCSTNDDDYEDAVDVESDSQGPIDNMLLQMYKKPFSFKQNGNSSDKVLIDISSGKDVAKVDSKTDKDVQDEVVHNTNEESSHTPSVTAQEKDTIIVLKPGTITKTETTANGEKKQQPESSRKRQRDKESDSSSVIVRKKAKIKTTESKFTFDDIGGNEKVLMTVYKLLLHMKYPEIIKQLSISPPRGFLLYGPPGCGKTLLAEAVAGELKIPLLKEAATKLVAGVSGESEARIRELFDEALAAAPCVVFIDEIDAIASDRATAQRGMEQRIVSQLLSCFDELNLKENAERILVIGATNRPDSLDPALRRAGRFDREVYLGIPDKEARAEILILHTKNVNLAPDVDLLRIAALTPGFVGVDLVSLITETNMAAMCRVLQQLSKSREAENSRKAEKSDQAINVDKQPDKNISFERSESSTQPIFVDKVIANTNDIVTESSEIPSSLEKASVVTTSVDSSNLKPPLVTVSDLVSWIRNKLLFSPECLPMICVETVDFENALKVVQPSAKREGFVTVPDVTWDDVGSLQAIREELQMAILAPIKYPECFEEFGLTAPAGILLCGPPGCGKTLLAKAIANEAGLNFISVKGPELLNMYVGESEKAVRQCFMRARNSAPCVIFFDELDGLCPKRSESESSATSRVVSQMLTEMDGVEGRQGVFIMAATNRPNAIDTAVLRPGRLDQILYVGLPSEEDRVEILRTLTKYETMPKIAEDVNLSMIARDARGFSGADLASLIRVASREAIKEGITVGFPAEYKICRRHISRALQKVHPSVSAKDLKVYEKMSSLYSINNN